MESVLDQRTGYVRVVLENIYQPHNASAVLRSCDAFGIQYVDVIEEQNAFRSSPQIELGSAQWLSIRRHRSSEGALQSIRSQGYRILAASPDPQYPTVANIDLHAGKIALVFGTELSGLSSTAARFADEFFRIPMYGFVESFNISVAAALCMYEITQALRGSPNESAVDWRLSEAERREVYGAWLLSSLPRADVLIRQFIVDEKRSLRGRMRALLRAMGEGERENESRVIRQGIQALPEWQRARSILAYYPVEALGEPRILPLLQEAYRAGAHIYLPCVEEVSAGEEAVGKGTVSEGNVGKEGLVSEGAASEYELVFRLWEGLDPQGLTTGKHGILQPKGAATEYLPERGGTERAGAELQRSTRSGKQSIILVPGLAFTSEGERLGRGAGLYDRFLAGSGIFSVAGCYKGQVCEYIPCEKQDIRLDKVIFPQ